MDSKNRLYLSIAFFVLLGVSTASASNQCQIISPLPVPVTIAGCTYSGTLPSNSTSYIQNTLSPTTTGQQFKVQDSSVSFSSTLSYIGGTQCLHSINGAVSGTGSDCGSGGGGSGVTVYPASATAIFPFGLQASTIQVTGLTGNMCVQTDGSGNLTSAAAACGSGSGGGSAFSLAITTGGPNAFFGTAISSSNSTTEILFDSATTNGLKFGGTYYYTMNPASVTLQGNSITFQMVGLTTASLQTQITATALSTQTLATAVGLSTASLQTQITATALSTQTVAVAVGLSTASLQTQITATALSTQTLAVAVGLSTASLQTQITATALSTQTLATAVGLSTASLQTQITATGVSTGSLAGNFPVSFSTNTLGTINIGTQSNLTASGAASLVGSNIGVGQISLSTGVFGTLAAAQEPAHTGDVTNSAGSLALTAFSRQPNITTFTSSITVTNLNGQTSLFSLFTGTSPSIVGSGSGHTQTGQLEVITAGTNSNLIVLSTSTTGNPVMTVSTSIALAPTDYLLSVSSAQPSSTMAFGVQNNGHWISSGTTPTPSSCGSSPVINGTDMGFTVTPGATATGCTITFTFPFANNPVCQVAQQTMSLANVLSYTHSTTQVAFTQVGAAAASYDVICIGQKG